MPQLLGSGGPRSGDGRRHNRHPHAQHHPVTERPPANIAAHLSSEESGHRLHRANNTEPGADRQEYLHLRRLEPDARLLTPIPSGCL